MISPAGAFPLDPAALAGGAVAGREQHIHRVERLGPAMAFEKYHHQVAVDTDQVREERHTAEDGTITITEVPVNETVEIVLPKWGQLPGGIFRKLRHADEAEQYFGLIEALHSRGYIDDDTLAKVDDLTLNDQMRLMTAWQEDSGISLPESSAS